jgi:hypothetical protein
MTTGKSGSIIIAVLIAAIFYLAQALVRVENERYALLVGMCQLPALPTVTGEGGICLNDLKCLATVQTRTGWWWHLFYALTD